MPERALRSLRAKSSKILCAGLLLRVAMATARTMLAEPAGIPWAFSGLLVWPNMLEKALFVIALPVLSKVPAVWHPVMVKLVKEVAIITLLA